MIIGSNERYLFSEQFPKHDAEAVDIELDSAVSVDVPPVLRWNVSDRAAVRSTTGLCRRVLMPLGQAKITYLCSQVKNQQIFSCIVA